MRLSESGEGLCMCVDIHVLWVGGTYIRWVSGICGMEEIICGVELVVMREVEMGTWAGHDGATHVVGFRGCGSDSWDELAGR